MSEKAKRRRKAVAMGAVALSAFMGVAATGLAVAVAMGPAAPVADEPQPEADWVGVATGAMASRGFGFAGAALDGGVLTITGDAPDADARVRAFETGRDAVLDDPRHAGQVLAFANALTIAGVAQDATPDAASALSGTPDAESCQTAYNTLLDGRSINFESGRAVIDAGSLTLLDSLSAVAKRCVSYRVEITGHTDARGDATANQSLSERRAQAVADRLVSNGVAATQLGVAGKGESEPLDASGTAEADARNRRIAFTVTMQPDAAPAP